MEKIKRNFYQKGEVDGAVLGYLIVVGLVIWGIASIFGFNYHGTSEGTVKYDDCREIIQLQSDSWHTYFGTFIGYARKTKSGRMMGGEFVRIVNDSPLIGSSHTCARAYVYEEKQDPACDNNKNGVSYPYLGYDDLCYTLPQ